MSSDGRGVRSHFKKDRLHSRLKLRFSSYCVYLSLCTPYKCIDKRGQHVLVENPISSGILVSKRLWRIGKQDTISNSFYFKKDFFLKKEDDIFHTVQKQYVLPDF